MEEDILEATRALSLSPSKRGSGHLKACTLGPSAHSKCSLTLRRSSRCNEALAPLDLQVNVLPLSTNITNLPGPTRSATLTFSKLVMPRGSYPKPATGSKRSRAELEEADVIIARKDAHSPAKLARHSSNSGSKAHEPIVISDDEDAGGVEATHVAEPTGDESSSPKLSIFADLYTYETPQKARSSKTDRRPLKDEVLRTDPDSGQLPKTSACSTTRLKVVKEDVALPTSAVMPRPVARRKTKAVRSAFVQPKKTRQLAKEAGISPLDLTAIPAAGFRLLGRCPFCAGSFAKSAAAKAKQEHMSSCAPLNGIKSSATAAENVLSDIRSTQRRIAEEGKRARDERTVLQEMVQEADIVRHEGRASQIEASPKKRGRDTVLIKKPIKRSAKATLFGSDEGKNSHAPISRYETHNLLPASNARLVARDLADQLFGSSTSEAIPVGKTENYREQQANSEAGGSSAVPESENTRSPRRTEAQYSTRHGNSVSPQIERRTCETNTLPYFSAEQMFASLSTTSSPQKSPFKALQKSRERQVSREQELCLGSESPRQDTESPSLPRTQPFSTSRLAERRRVADGKQRPVLFGAESTNRSLLDLVSDHRKLEASEDPNELKRKPIDVDLQAQGDRAKRCRTVTDDIHDADDKHRLTASSSTQIVWRRSTDAAEHPCASGSDTSDMDVDVPSIDAAALLPSQQHVSGSCEIGKHSDQSSGTGSNKSVVTCTVTHLFDSGPSHSPSRDPVESSINSIQVPVVAGDSDTVAELDMDSKDEDDDDDAQSFLELLEPLDPSRTSAIASDTNNGLEASWERLDELDESETRPSASFPPSSFPPPSGHKMRRLVRCQHTDGCSGNSSVLHDTSPSLTDVSSP